MLRASFLLLLVARDGSTSAEIVFKPEQGSSQEDVTLRLAANPGGLECTSQLGAAGFLCASAGTELCGEIERLESLVASLNATVTSLRASQASAGPATPNCGLAGKPACQTCKELFNGPLWTGPGVYTVQPAGWSEPASVYCSAAGWTQFMKANRIDGAWDSGARANTPNTNSWKLSDTQISALIQSSGGTLRFDCGSYAWVVPDWASLTHDSWQDWSGEWSTTNGPVARAGHQVRLPVCHGLRTTLSFMRERGRMPRLPALLATLPMQPHGSCQPSSLHHMSRPHRLCATGTALPGRGTSSHNHARPAHLAALPRLSHWKLVRGEL